VSCGRSTLPRPCRSAALSAPPALLLLAGYVFLRAALGALLNPPFNGPDEAGHVEYVRSFVESGGRHVTGVEVRQFPTYYALAALPWLATSHLALAERLFALRLLSAAAGVATTVAVALAAHLLWPHRPLLALAAASVAALAPGHLYLLASVSNDPLAAAFASLSVLAALRLGLPVADAQGGRWQRGRWWLAWLVTSTLAIATKLTSLPVVLASSGVLLWRHRRDVWRRRWARALLGAGAVGGLAIYAALLSQHPTTSLGASLARFWPLAVLRAPVAYWQQGGLAESVRTFWYGYDYEVAWPPALESALAVAVLGAGLAALAGLALRGREVPGLLWAAAAVQVALVVGRYGFGDVLQIAMGGAAQAKAFLPAIVPLSILFVAGLAAAGDRAGLRDDRWLLLGLLAWLLALDGTSLALGLWHHYRWSQIGF
jgi:hypothetical protein